MTVRLTTYDEWVQKLESKTLDFLLLQNRMGRGWNGKAYDDAVCDVIREKRSRGEEEVPRKRPKQDIPDDDDEEYVITHEKCGPKGMTERVRTPKHLFSG